MSVTLHLTEAKEIRAGVLIYRKQGDNAHFLLVRRLKGNEYDTGYILPKGHIVNGESMQQSAQREGEEETGLRFEIEQSLGSIKYTPTYEDMPQTIYFFLARYTEGGTDLEGNVLDGDNENNLRKFFPIKTAEEIIDPQLLPILKKAQKLLH